MNAKVTDKLIALARALVNQESARVLVEPRRRSAGFWFGGGNLVYVDGAFYIVGRYRNYGDSRTGLQAGLRGLELAIFRSRHFEGPYEKVKSFSKADLTCGGQAVVSIEGSCLLTGPGGVELLVSTEKDRPYPPPYQEFRKAGTGVWSIDSIRAGRIESLDASAIQPALSGDAPATLHVKDPVGFVLPDGREAMIYCTHPFTWASSSSGLAVRSPGGAFEVVADSLLGRGACWDVAATRVTDRLPLPRLGALRDLPAMSLYFYDAAECLREHEQNRRGVRRVRGYSCEEIGGLAVGADGEFPALVRLSVNEPLFISPYGTGCSRYVSTLTTDEAVYAAWQQSQDDLSQPLVGHRLPMETVERILA